jgi:hypothetical protein
MVWCRNNYKDVNIARLLLNLDAGKVVRYRNGNGLDLTRGNLLVVNCMSKYRTRALMKRGNPKQRCEIKHIYEEEKVSA